MVDTGVRRDAPVAPRVHARVFALADLVGRPELGGLQHAVDATAGRLAARHRGLAA